MITDGLLIGEQQGMTGLDERLALRAEPLEARQGLLKRTAIRSLCQSNEPGN